MKGAYDGASMIVNQSRISRDLVAATVKWRQILPSVNQPPRHLGGYGSWSQCRRKSEMGSP